MAHKVKDGDSPKKEPVQRFTAWTGSRVEAAVFQHVHGDIVNYSVSLGRSWKKDDGSYESSSFMDERSLLAAAFVLQQAFAWINEQGR